MGDWKTIKKGNKTTAHQSSLAPQINSTSGSFDLLAVDPLNGKNQVKQPSQSEQIPKTAPPPTTARNASPRSNNNKSKIPAGSTKTVLTDLHSQKTDQMKKAAPTKPPKPASVRANGKAPKAIIRSRVAKKSGIISLRTLLLALIAFTAYHWAYTCPSQGYPPRSSATNVCKSVFHFEHSIWRPYGVPALQYLSSTKPVHEAQQQYDKHVRPFVDPLVLQSQVIHRKYGAPILSQAKSLYVAYGEPTVAQGQTLYRQHVDPHVQKGYSAVMKEYDTYLGKHVNAAYASVNDFYKKHVAPHTAPAAKAANSVFEGYVVPAYKRTVPLVQKAGATAFTAYREVIDPFARKSIAIAHESYEKHVAPAIAKLWEEHGRPHYEAALSKLGFNVKPAPKQTATTKAREGAKAVYENAKEDIKVRATEAAQAAKDKEVKAAEVAKAKAREATEAAKKKADEIKAKVKSEQEAALAKANAAKKEAKIKAEAAHEAAKKEAKIIAEAAHEAAKKEAKIVADAAHEAAKEKANVAPKVVGVKETVKQEVKNAENAAKKKANDAAESVHNTAEKVKESVAKKVETAKKVTEQATKEAKVKVAEVKEKIQHSEL